MDETKRISHKAEVTNTTKRTYRCHYHRRNGPTQCLSHIFVKERRSRLSFFILINTKHYSHSLRLLQSVLLLLSSLLLSTLHSLCSPSYSLQYGVYGVYLCMATPSSQSLPCSGPSSFTSPCLASNDAVSPSTTTVTVACLCSLCVQFSEPVHCPCSAIVVRRMTRGPFTSPGLTRCHVPTNSNSDV